MAGTDDTSQSTTILRSRLVVSPFYLELLDNRASDKPHEKEYAVALDQRRRNRVPKIKAGANISPSTSLSRLHTALHSTDRCQHTRPWSHPHAELRRRRTRDRVCQLHAKWRRKKLQCDQAGMSGSSLGHSKTPCLSRGLRIHCRNRSSM